MSAPVYKVGDLIIVREEKAALLTAGAIVNPTDYFTHVDFKLDGNGTLVSRHRWQSAGSWDVCLQHDIADLLGRSLRIVELPPVEAVDEKADFARARTDADTITELRAELAACVVEANEFAEARDDARGEVERMQETIDIYKAECDGLRAQLAALQARIGSVETLAGYDESTRQFVIYNIAQTMKTIDGNIQNARTLGLLVLAERNAEAFDAFTRLLAACGYNKQHIADGPFAKEGATP